MNLSITLRNSLKILLISTIFFAFSACSEKKENLRTDTDKLLPKIEMETTSVSASGEVIPRVKSELSFQNNAKNLDVLVQPGEEVKEGDVLVTSDDLQQISDVELAEARLADAKSVYDILKRNSARKIQQDAAIANIKAAESALEETLKKLRSTKLYAPFSGTVIEIFQNSFENANAGEPVVLLADMKTQVVETTDLNEIDVKKIKIGDIVEISYDAFPDIRIDGEVVDIMQKSNSSSGVNYTVTIKPAKVLDQLRWGMSAFVVINISVK